MKTFFKRKELGFLKVDVFKGGRWVFIEEWKLKGFFVVMTGLHVKLPKQSPRSLNGSATSLSSLDTTAGSHSPSSPRNNKTLVIHRLFGRNKESHGAHSGREDSENEDGGLQLKLNVPTTRNKQFSKVLAEIRERTMPSSLGRRRSKTQESSTSDSRNSADSDGGQGRPRGAASAVSSSSGTGSEIQTRGRSGTALSLNEDDSGEVDSLDGTFSSQDKDYEEVDGQIIDSEKRKQQVEHLNFKIRITKEQIRQLQEERDEYVKEYLESTEGGSQKSKAVFEKKNQKNNTLVAQLQKKLEKYHNTLIELEMNGAAPSGHIAKEVFNGRNFHVIVVHFMATVKPSRSLPKISVNETSGREIVQPALLSPKCEIDGLEEEPNSSLGEEGFVGDSNLSPARYNSDEDSSSVASATHIGGPVRGNSPRHSLPPSPPTSYEQDISELRETNTRLKKQIDNLTLQLDIVAESLQEERCKSEQLRDSLKSITTEWNDVSELRQNEMITVKQELERAEERIERIEYRSAERANEIEEALDSYVTRVLKIEAFQQQSQQMMGLDDYFDQSAQAKALLSKFLTVVLAIVQIILIICTTLARIVIPFTRTRVRIAITSVVVLSVALLWRYQESDNVRIVMDSVSGQFTIIKDRLASLGSPIQNFVRKIYQRDKS
ncbi:Transmembrane and coiled-coil domains protein 1 [Stylophora pistillata]|uniref:Transmembrane and coiled-coil domains protein 1 n=1 Tax=Stylophora pistillata TaxID=50429 RepID=A0A2B4RJA4_STYPI|nr:Transmembrane and coiled-coil domains protein 1 [Stylophora pistillata]